jgi:anti-sigma regulatory factor (Ser/Thr protein kinase)
MSEHEQFGACPLTGGPESIGTAREYARRFMLEADPVIAPAVGEDALLAVSEMVTNAVRYAPGACVLEIWLYEQQIRLSVTDTSQAVPRSRTAQFDGSGGFGLHLLRKLAGEVETMQRADGKTVSVRLDRTPHPLEQPRR